MNVLRFGDLISSLIEKPEDLDTIESIIIELLSDPDSQFEMIEDLQEGLSDALENETIAIIFCRLRDEVERLMNKGYAGLKEIFYDEYAEHHDDYEEKEQALETLLQRLTEDPRVMKDKDGNYYYDYEYDNRQRDYLEKLEEEYTQGNKSLEIRNQKFLDSLENPDIELILLTQNGIEYIREGYDITGARMIPTPGTYYDMLCTYKDGQYVDCIPYPVFLEKGGDIARIDSFGELLDTGNYTYEESVEHGTWRTLNEGITALKVGMIIGAAYGDTLEERYSHLQPIVDQVASMDLNSPETAEKISRLVEELEDSLENPENAYSYLDDLEDEKVGRQKRRNDRPKEYRRPSGLAHKDAILTQLYDQDKQLGALQPEKSTGKDDKDRKGQEEDK